LSTTPKYAWTSEAAHGGGAGTLAVNQPFKQMAIVSYDNKEYIVVANDAGGAGEISSVEIADKKQFTGKYTLVAGFGTKPKMVASTDKLFFVGGNGLTSMALTDLGTTKTLDAIDPATTGSDNWRMQVAGAPTDNRIVQEIALHNNKIFISLYPGNPLRNYTGGIAVYDIKTNKTIKPDQEIWNKVSATGLLVHNNRLRAIVNGVWIEVNDKGGIGEESFAIADIVNNKFKKDKLASADLTRPLYRIATYVENFGMALKLIVPVGSDFIMQMNSMIDDIPSSKQLTVHYEDKEIEVKKPAEKQE
jgi:hypothetical protein